MSSGNADEFDAVYVEGLEDALDHIARICRGSRTSTKRLRWIEQRAECALSESDEWRHLDLPRVDPKVASLERVITAILPLAHELEPIFGPTAPLLSEDDFEQVKAFMALVRKNCPWLMKTLEDKDGSAN